jgi:hypothetical protein
MIVNWVGAGPLAFAWSGNVSAAPRIRHAMPTLSGISASNARSTVFMTFPLAYVSNRTSRPATIGVLRGLFAEGYRQSAGLAA